MAKVLKLVDYCMMFIYPQTIILFTNKKKQTGCSRRQEGCYTYSGVYSGYEILKKTNLFLQLD